MGASAGLLLSPSFLPGRRDRSQHLFSELLPAPLSPASPGTPRPVRVGSGTWVSCPLFCPAPHPFPSPCRSALTPAVPSAFPPCTGCSPQHPSGSASTLPQPAPRVPPAPALRCPHVSRGAAGDSSPWGETVLLLALDHASGQLTTPCEPGEQRQACRPMQGKSQSLWGNTKLSPRPVSSREPQSWMQEWGIQPCCSGGCLGLLTPSPKHLALSDQDQMVLSPGATFPSDE